MRPIPARLLIHGAALKTPIGQDTWQQPVYTPDVELKRIRIEPCSKIVLSKENTEVQLTSTLLYDCRTSAPKGMVFTHGQKVAFNGIEYTVLSVEPLYDECRLHHWEVGLQ